MVDIGNFELPIVYDVEELDSASVDEVPTLPPRSKDLENVAIKHESGMKTIVIYGFLNPHLHSSNKSLSDQKEDIRDLRKTDVSQNSINYKHYKGHLLIEEVNVVENSESKIISDVEIRATYFPWPKFYRNSEP